MVPNNRAARLFIFSEYVPPTRLIWHYITVHTRYTLINFQGFCPTYTVIWTPRLFGTLEYTQIFTPKKATKFNKLFCCKPGYSKVPNNHGVQITM